MHDEDTRAHLKQQLGAQIIETLEASPDVITSLEVLHSTVLFLILRQQREGNSVQYQSVRQATVVLFQHLETHLEGAREKAQASAEQSQDETPKYEDFLGNQSDFAPGELVTDVEIVREVVEILHSRTDGPATGLRVLCAATMSILATCERVFPSAHFEELMSWARRAFDLDRTMQDAKTLAAVENKPHGPTGKGAN